VPKKPNPEEFGISKTGIVHRPTKERFFAHPGKPADGHWQDGHALAAAEYDQDEVRRMGRMLWAKHVVERKSSR
jgi:hypothetical protein